MVTPDGTELTDERSHPPQSGPPPPVLCHIYVPPPPPTMRVLALWLLYAVSCILLGYSILRLGLDEFLWKIMDIINYPLGWLFEEMIVIGDAHPLFASLMATMVIIINRPFNWLHEEPMIVLGEAHPLFALLMTTMVIMVILRNTVTR